MKKAIIIVVVIIVLFVGFGIFNIKRNYNNINPSDNMFDSFINHNSKLTEIVTPNDYGKEINYSVTINGTELSDWKIFYNDGNNVYIILSGYLENYLIPASTRMISTKRYCTYWTKDFLHIPYNESAVNTLTNSANWNLFKNDYAEGATGAPTMEMYIASWNAKGYIPIYYGKDKENVYALSFNASNLDIGDSTYNDMRMEIYERGIDMNLNIPDTENGKYDELYCPSQQPIDGCYGYWIAARNYYSDFYVYVSVKGSLLSYQLDRCDRCGIRPVVCLKSDTMGTVEGNTIILK